MVHNTDLGNRSAVRRNGRSGKYRFSKMICSQFCCIDTFSTAYCKEHICFLYCRIIEILSTFSWVASCPYSHSVVIVRPAFSSAGTTYSLAAFHALSPWITATFFHIFPFHHEASNAFSPMVKRGRKIESLRSCFYLLNITLNLLCLWPNSFLHASGPELPDHNDDSCGNVLPVPINMYFWFLVQLL